MLEISRMQAAMDRRPSFASRVFTREERVLCERADRPARRFAACYAARLATRKALRIPPAEVLGRYDISVEYGPAGHPQVRLRNRAALIAEEGGVREVALSLSFTHELAVASAVALTDEVRPKVEQRARPGDELMTSFREARSMLDELERVHAEEADAPAVADEQGE